MAMKIHSLCSFQLLSPHAFSRVCSLLLGSSLCIGLMKIDFHSDHVLN